MPTMVAAGGRAWYDFRGKRSFGETYFTEKCRRTAVSSGQWADLTLDKLILKEAAEGNW